MKWVRRAAICLLIEAGWFGLVHPLVPSTITGFAIEFVEGILVVSALLAAAFGMWWLAGRESHPALTRIAALSLALSVGGIIFCAAYVFRKYFSGNFHYFIFRH